MFLGSRSLLQYVTMSDLTHIYCAVEDSDRAACGGRMTKHTTVVPTCPKCRKTHTARQELSRKQLLKDIDKLLTTKSLSMLHRAVYLAEQEMCLMVNASTNQNGETGLDTLLLPPNTEYVFFTLFKETDK